MSEADEEQLDFFLMANLRHATTGLPMVVWVSERGLARHDVRVKVSTVHGPRVQYANIATVAVRPGAAARRRPSVISRFAVGQRVDPAQRGGAGGLLGLSDRHCPIDPALTAAVAADTAMNEPGITEQIIDGTNAARRCRYRVAIISCRLARSHGPLKVRLGWTD
jgi:hypothetical protein